MQHKHYELIIKWAANPDKYIVEVWSMSKLWQPVLSSTPLWKSDRDYRLVPKKEQVRIVHRKCLQKMGGKYYYYTVNVMPGETMEDAQLRIERSPYFVEWVGDWITSLFARECSKEESVS